LQALVVGWIKGLANVCNFVSRILKFLRVGKVQVEGTEFSCHDEFFLKAGINPIVNS